MVSHEYALKRRQILTDCNALRFTFLALDLSTLHSPPLNLNSTINSTPNSTASAASVRSPSNRQIALIDAVGLVHLSCICSKLRVPVPGGSVIAFGAHLKASQFLILAHVRACARAQFPFPVPAPALFCV